MSEPWLVGNPKSYNVDSPPGMALWTPDWTGEGCDRSRPRPGRLSKPGEGLMPHNGWPPTAHPSHTPRCGCKLVAALKVSQTARGRSVVHGGRVYYSGRCRACQGRICEVRRLTKTAGRWSECCKRPECVKARAEAAADRRAKSMRRLRRERKATGNPSDYVVKRQQWLADHGDCHDGICENELAYLIDGAQFRSRPSGPRCDGYGNAKRR